MADVAFLLLVFFLVTTVFPKDHGLALVLPEGQADVGRVNVLHLLVRDDGAVDVRLGENPQSQLISAGDVGALWRGAVASNPNLIAAVKTHPAAPHRFMIDVLDALQLAGAERISLQILEDF